MPQPGREPNFSNLCYSVCSLKCIHLCKRALSSSLSQYSAAEKCSENVILLLGVIERGYSLQFRCRTPCFNGVAQSLTLPQNALVLRQELCKLLEKGAIERVPAGKLESGFYSRYFVVSKRDGGLHPILDLRPINGALCKCPFRMISLKKILAQIRPRDWLRLWI